MQGRGCLKAIFKAKPKPGLHSLLTRFSTSVDLGRRETFLDCVMEMAFAVKDCTSGTALSILRK